MQRIVLDAPQDLHKINRLLREYAGYPIKLWSYGISHSHLDLRFDRRTAGNFHLRFGAVTAIILPKLLWTFNGQISYDEKRQYSAYEFIDEGASVRIECGIFRLEENVEPVYH